MQVYESLLQDWGRSVDIPISIKNEQTCRIEFEEEEVTMQIDLDPSGEQLVLGCLLGIVNPGPYQDLVFKAALRANGLTSSPRGILSFSDKLGALMLHEFLPIATINIENLGNMIILFRTHAKVWIDALKQEEIPTIQTESTKQKSSGMFGMK